MTTTIRGMRLEDMVNECISRFCKIYPAQLDDLKRRMANLRSIQMSDTATSDLVGWIGEIPVELDAILKINISPHWRHDPEVRNIFWRLFRVGRANPHNYHAGDFSK